MVQISQEDLDKLHKLRDSFIEVESKFYKDMFYVSEQIREFRLDLAKLVIFCEMNSIYKEREDFRLEKITRQVELPSEIEI